MPDFALMAHQRRFVGISQTQPRYGWWAAPGVGKTIGVLAAVAAAKDHGEVGKTLVLAPLSILKTAWVADAAHFPQLHAVAIYAATPAKRRRMLADAVKAGADVFVTNYETFKRMQAEFLAAGVTRLVVDESSKAKQFDSQISKACHEFSDRMQSVFMLSGTPAPNCDTEFFSQIRCIDARLFGTNFWRFAYQYFHPVKRMIGGKERIIGWKPIAERRAEFQDKLASVSWSLTKAECLDLPPETNVVREVDLSPAELDAYHGIIEELRCEVEGRTLTAAGQAKAMKLRQITGGAFIDAGVAHVIGRAKLDATAEILDEIGPRPVVMWAEFTNEIDRLATLCRERGESVAVIDGRSRDRAPIIEAFQRGEIARLICHPQAGGHGITLTRAKYDIFYSLSYSFETYEQARNRIYRAGQDEPVTHYHVLARGTIDDKLLDCLAGKRSGHDAVMAVLGMPIDESVERRGKLCAV